MPCNRSTMYPEIVPTIAPKQKISNPVDGSMARIRNAASPIVAVKTATKDPKEILP